MQYEINMNTLNFFMDSGDALLEMYMYGAVDYRELWILGWFILIHV